MASKTSNIAIGIIVGVVVIVGIILLIGFLLEWWFVRKPSFTNSNLSRTATVCSEFSYSPEIKGGKNLVYSMTASPSAPWLSINSSTGVITSAHVPLDMEETKVTVTATEDTNLARTATQTLTITRGGVTTTDATWDPATKSSNITITDNLVSKPRDTQSAWVYADIIPQNECIIHFDLSGMDLNLTQGRFFFGIYDSKAATTDGAWVNNLPGFDLRFERFGNGEAFVGVADGEFRSEATSESRDAFQAKPFSMLIVDSKVVSVRGPDETIELDPPVVLDSNTNYYIGVRRPSTTNTQISVRVSYEYCA